MKQSKRYIIVLIGIIFLVNCSANTNSKTVSQSTKMSSPLTSPTEVKILKYKFVPHTLKIEIGQTVRWVNMEKRQYHSVWFDQHSEEESDYLFPGDKLDKQFTKPGRYPYRRGPPPEMVGMIIVK